MKKFIPFCCQVPQIIQTFRSQNKRKNVLQNEAKKIGNRAISLWKTSKNPSIFKILLKMFGLEFFYYAVLLFTVEILFITLQPYIFEKLLLSHTKYHKENITEQDTLMNALYLVLIHLLQCVNFHYFTFGLSKLGIQVRIACSSLIYQSVLHKNRGNTEGEIINLLSNDLNRFEYALLYIHYLWLCPCQILLAVYFFDRTINHMALTAIVIYILCLLVQTVLGKKFPIFRQRIAQNTVKRISLMNEIITNIKIIKMYCWETSFINTIQEIRKTEVKEVVKACYLKAINASFNQFVNNFALLFWLGCSYLTGTDINYIFVFLTYNYNTLLKFLVTTNFPLGITAISEIGTTMERIQNCLSQCQESTPSKLILAPEITDNLINFKDISVRYESSDLILKNINFNANLGDLVIVTGPPGSGKSTLVKTILNETLVTEGRAHVSGTVSYVSQEPWLFLGTVKENILFGLSHDVAKYQHVIKICGLEPDLKSLASSDDTIVGERGMMLSGGQRSRINLARAIYKDADIYILDHPLSSVDSQTGKKIFQECISNYLREKCVIFISHQKQYFKYARTVYSINEGEISILSESNENERNFEQVFDRNHDNEDKNTENFTDKIQMKDTENGSIDFRIYKKFYFLLGYCFIIFLLCLVVCNQIPLLMINHFTLRWVDDAQSLEENPSSIKNEYLTIENFLYFFSGLVLLIIILTYIRYSTLVYFFKRASTKLHNMMIEKIIHSKMTFFDNNPSGRILNRCSNDIGVIDELLPPDLMNVIQLYSNGIGTLLIITSTYWWFGIATTIFAIVIYGLLIIFSNKFSNIARIETKTRSTIYNHVTATIQGLTTIRASKAERFLMDQFFKHLQANSSSYYYQILIHGVFAFCINIICLLYITYILVVYTFFKTNVLIGSLGLAISHSFGLNNTIQMLFKCWGKVNSHMIAVERVFDYIALPSETVENRIEATWPESGGITFSSVNLRYKSDNDHSLKNINLTIKPREKIGIIGRTGSGKSSLLSILLHLYDFEGLIEIDNVDTKQVGLRDLRKRISIIPQEPVLFSGTLRSNLDNFNEFSDEAIWSALREVKLIDVISQFDAGLETVVSSDSTLLSVGQQQLICLARVLLSPNKILVLDEATANVDAITDKLIHDIIEEKFKNSTILMIAHRLSSVIKCDKILTLHNGEVVEFEHPYLLLLNQNSYFYRFVIENGTNVLEDLLELAKLSYLSPK